MLPIIPIAMGISSILGAAGKARGEAQGQNEDRILKRAQVDLQRRQHMLDAPGQRVKAAKSASMVANYQPHKVNWAGPGSGLRGQIPEITGGFNNPDMYSQDTRALANDTIKKHLVASLTGADNVPELPEMGKSNWLDKILGIGGLGSSLLGAVGAGRGRASNTGAGGDINM
jgi:hypothetical protein